MEEEKRSATEILLSIEAKLIVLEKRTQNTEFLLKTLLSKTNSTNSNAGSIPPPVQNTIPVTSNVINKDNFELRPKTNVFAELAAQQGIDLDMTESASIRTATRGQRGPKPSGGQKISVSQILSFGDSPVFLANVEVLNENNELINQSRTNNKGRWMMALAQGSYQVHVTKRFAPDSGKKSIDTTYQIEVPLSDKPLELDPRLINEG